jgi:hypothetical protein
LLAVGLAFPLAGLLAVGLAFPLAAQLAGWLDGQSPLFGLGVPWAVLSDSRLVGWSAGGSVSMFRRDLMLGSLWWLEILLVSSLVSWSLASWLDAGS